MSTSTSSPNLIRYFLHTKNLWNPPTTQLPLQLIPDSTQNSILRFYHLRDRKLALASQLLQRLIICQTYFPKVSSLQEISIWKDPESGRPSYKNQKDIVLHNNHNDNNDSIIISNCKEELIDYNVSHHSNLVAIAAVIRTTGNGHGDGDTHGQQNSRIGVDIVPRSLPIPHGKKSSHEYIISYLSAYIDPAAKVFTEFEIKTIESPSRIQDKIRMLYLHWALKEAYVKAVGTGLVTDLLKIEFRDVRIFDLVNMDTTIRERFTDAKMYLDGKWAEDWYVEVTSLRDVDEQEEIEGYYIAVVTERSGLSEDDMDRGWKELDLERDIMPWDGRKEGGNRESVVGSEFVR